MLGFGLSKHCILCFLVSLARIPNQDIGIT